MKRKQSLPLPLELVKDFEKTHPGCWEWIDYVREGNFNSHTREGVTGISQ